MPLPSATRNFQRTREAFDKDRRRFTTHPSASCNITKQSSKLKGESLSVYGNRRRPTEQRKMPLAAWQTVDHRRQLALHQHHRGCRHACRNRQHRVHADTQRAMLFTTRSLRRIRWRTNLGRMVRQPVAMDMNRLRRACDSRKQQADSRHPPQPQGMRGCHSSALESFRQEVQGVTKARFKRTLYQYDAPKAPLVALCAKFPCQRLVEKH